jgi:hypothetical protein
MEVRFSALCAGHRLIPGIFLVLISVDPRAIVRLERLGHSKSSNELSGNRACDLPAPSIAPLETQSHVKKN